MNTVSHLEVGITNKNISLDQVLSELKAEYLQLLPQKISDLRKHFFEQEKDWENLKTLFHNLKGTGKTYGFAQVSLICEPMEDLCEQFLKNTNSESDLELLLLGIELLEQITTSYQNNIELNLTNNSTAMRLLITKQTSKNKHR